MEYETIVGKNFPKVVIPLIDSARHTIQTVVFDWRWYPNDPGSAVQLFNQALVRAVHRGVKIQAIANNDDIIRTLKEQGMEARRVILKNIVHAKLMIIDDLTVVLGSHNYTQNAFTMNQEISVALFLKEKSVDFDAFFSTLWVS